MVLFIVMVMAGIVAFVGFGGAFVGLVFSKQYKAAGRVFVMSIVCTAISAGCAYSLFHVTPEEALAKKLTAQCKADWEELQHQSFRKYGIANFATPDYCYDTARNKKHYGVQ